MSQITLMPFKEEEHYEIISDWWTKQKWPVIPLDALPKTGFIAYKNDTPLAGGFLYNTDSTFSIMEWIVGNPDVDYEDRGEGLDKVIEGLSIVAKALGKKFMHIMVKHERLIKRLEDHEFQVVDTDLSSVLRSF